MLENWQRGGFGLYIHWPYCEAKCPYCDFNSHVSRTIDQDRWKAAYLSELDRLGAETEGRVLESVFFGGGTPSLMDPSLVDAIMSKVSTLWTPSNRFEVTLEANPSSVEAGRFAGYKDAGINRVSLGVQALNDADLGRLGRLHSTQEAMKALEIAETTFDRFSFDLIYARQDQTLDGWEKELTKALSIGATHMSLYQLTIEKGTAFGRRFANGALHGLPSEDLAADMYELTQELCTGRDLPAYEVSNHAKTGQESQHNLIYWRGGDFIGIGPGAHGRLTLNGMRYGTETTLAPERWLQDVEKRGRGEKDRSVLSPEDQTTEMILMGLRLQTGVERDRLHQDELIVQSARTLSDDGLLDVTDTHYRLTAQGRPLLNSVATELLRNY